MTISLKIYSGTDSNRCDMFMGIVITTYQHFSGIDKHQGKNKIRASQNIFGGDILIV